LKSFPGNLWPGRKGGLEPNFWGSHFFIEELKNFGDRGWEGFHLQENVGVKNFCLLSLGKADLGRVWELFLEFSLIPVKSRDF